jgi:excisionase family DNA binding protein
MNDPDLLTVAQVAEVCNATNQTIRNWIKNGTLRSQRIGNRFLIPREELDRIGAGARWQVGEGPWDYSSEEPPGPLPRKSEERHPDADPTEGLLGV